MRQILLTILTLIIGAHAAKLQGTCVFLPFLIIGAHAAKLQGTCVFLPFLIIIRGQAAKLRDTYCFRTFSYYYYPAIGVYGSP